MVQQLTPNQIENRVITATSRAEGSIEPGERFEVSDLFVGISWKRLTQHDQAQIIFEFDKAISTGEYGEFEKDTNVNGAYIKK